MNSKIFHYEPKDKNIIVFFFCKFVNYEKENTIF